MRIRSYEDNNDGGRIGETMDGWVNGHRREPPFNSTYIGGRLKVRGREWTYSKGTQLSGRSFVRD